MRLTSGIIGWLKPRPKLVVLLVPVMLLALLLPLFSFSKAQAMKAMNCRPRASAEFEARVAEENARHLYTPKDEKSSFSVTLHFNLDDSILADTVMTVESAAADLATGNGLLYRGPYKKAFSLRIGNELLDEGRSGMDNLAFRFFNRKNHEICVQEQEGGALYWKPNANVYIDFLDHKEIDNRSGTPIAHKVRIE